MMFRLTRTSVIAWTALVAVIAALSYALTGGAVPRAAAAEDKAKASPVEFTADGKLKRPVGYRTWVYRATLRLKTKENIAAALADMAPLRL